MKRTKNDRKGKKLKKLREEESVELYIKSGKWIEVDPSKVSFIGYGVSKPRYFKDYHFSCKDCGSLELWTARQQKWWYEEAGGKLETKAVRCRACRLKERLRKSEARRVHLDGIAKNK